MWSRMTEMNQMNQKLMESIQRKKRLRQTLQEMNQKREEEQINELKEWASLQTKLLLSDIELYEKEKYQREEHEKTIKLQQIGKKDEEYKEEKEEKEKEEEKEENMEIEEKEKKSSEKQSNLIEALEELEKTAKAANKSSNAIIAELFGKKINNDNNDNDNNSDDDISSISSIRSKNDNEETEDIENKELEALRKRIDKMKSDSTNKKSYKSLKSVVLSIIFISYLKKLVDEHRPKISEEFNRNLLQIQKPYMTLTCNLLKLSSLSVFRSIMRSKISLVQSNNKSKSNINNIFKSIFKFKENNYKKNIDENCILFIRVHVLKLINCINEYFQKAPNVLIQFFNEYLLTDRPALFQYVYVSEHSLLEWDKYNFVANYTKNQKKMILLNFVAIRCMLKQIIFGNVEHNKLKSNQLFNESNQKINLFCIASVYYYIIRAYNSKILKTNQFIQKDFEIGQYQEKLLNDKHPIYDKLDNLIQDGINNIHQFMDHIIDKISAHTDDSSSDW